MLTIPGHCSECSLTYLHYLLTSLTLNYITLNINLNITLT